MDWIVSFFSDIPTVFRALILIGGVVVFWTLEGVLPLFPFQYKKIRHAGLNLFFTMTTAIINFGLAGVLLLTSDFVSDNHYGLIYLLEFPFWALLIAGLLLMDLIGAYCAHFIEHKIKWMWKFHLVHHSDLNIDVTSGLRHHPGESLIRFGFTLVAVLIVGAPIWLVMLYQSLSVLFAHITHANINFPKRLDRALSYIFVTPLMHKVHHHYQRPLTDTNFGNIFSIWDRLFGTYAQVEDSKKLIYGVDTHMEVAENERLGNLLKIPFQPYRKSDEFNPID
jgi:sterol desaturase/sphingolipid hydroxylase (fatty acid hydroxylase superfamily)